MSKAFIMDNCNKYQSLFVFRDDDELNKHLEICPVCKQKHDEMMKLESLIKSAQPIHQKQKTIHWISVIEESQEDNVI